MAVTVTIIIYRLIVNSPLLTIDLARLEITIDEDIMNGVACNLESQGFQALCKATEEIVGHVEPYSITGSLPLIRELQVWEETGASVILGTIAI